MHGSNLNYLPLAPLFFLALVVIGLVVVALQIGIIGYAYEKMGISGRWVYGLLLASLLGSYINIPVAEVGGGQAVTNEIFPFRGMQYVVPVLREAPTTILAINVGGAIIPTVLSIYLMAKNEMFSRGLIGVTIVSLVVHAMAQPIEGKGIAVPVFVPPILAAAVAMLLSRRIAAPLAYVSGCLGTLIGADLMNLHRLMEVGAPVASIGGAGTFDGIFLTGMLAVLLAH